MSISVDVNWLAVDSSLYDALRTGRTLSATSLMTSFAVLPSSRWTFQLTPNSLNSADSGFRTYRAIVTSSRELSRMWFLSLLGPSSVLLFVGDHQFSAYNT